jgi:hypothetical protein
MALEKPKVLLLGAAVLLSAALGVDNCVQTDRHHAGVFRDRVKSWSGETWSTETVLAQRRKTAEWLDEYPSGENKGEAKYFLVAAWVRVGAYALMWGAVASMLIVILSPFGPDSGRGRPRAHRVVFGALIVYPIVLAIFWAYSNRGTLEEGTPSWSLFLGLGGYLLTFLFFRDTRALYPNGWGQRPTQEQT